MRKEEIEFVKKAIKEFGDGFWTEKPEDEETSSNDSLFDEIVSFVNKAGYDLRLERLKREFEIIHEANIENLPPNWKTVVENCQYKFVRGIFADFGLAEECVGLLIFEISEGTPYFEVGVGEALRPYIVLYKGVIGYDASRVFSDEIEKLKYL